MERDPILARMNHFKTVVCITDQRHCSRIIHAGKLLSDVTGTDLIVVNVAKPGEVQDPDTLEYLFNVSKEKNAELVLLYSEDVAKAIIRYIKNNKVSHLFTGVPKDGDSITTRIWQKFSHITFFIVEPNGDMREVARPVFAARDLMSRGVCPIAD